MPFAGWFSDRFGRKKAILLIAILYVVSALGSAFAPSFEFLVAARFLGGLAFSSITLASMYIGEIAPPAWRGKLVSMTQINIVVGLSGAYFVNYYILKLVDSDAVWVSKYAVDTQTWRWMLGSEIPFALLWFVLLFKIPESPYWLVSRDRFELAEIFINNRGQSEIVHDSTTEGYPIGDMVQERVPLREETEAVGHAVLALYYYAGAADVYAETGEQALVDALDRVWDKVVNRKMYITGAVGQTHWGASSRRDTIEEGFIDEFMMPNMTAYNETCANICNAPVQLWKRGGETKG